MSNLESWAFFCMMGCMLLVTLSLTVLTGEWVIAASLIAAVLGKLNTALPDRNFEIVGNVAELAK